MKISVVLTTFQGEKYILEQLESIRNQTMKPDEVLIRDDNSLDSTRKKVEQYVKKYNLVNWKIIENVENIGWKINFKKGISEATGDIIFLCDQDDIWMQTKIEEMVNIHQQNPKIELLVSKFITIDNKKTKKNNFTNGLDKIAFDEKFIHNKYPGCVYSFRKSLFSSIVKYWNNDLPHDQQLWIFSNLRDTLYLYNKPLIFYRRHDETATGRDDLSRKTKLRNIQYEYQGLLSINLYAKNNEVDIRKKKLIEEANEYISKRINFFKNGTPANFFRTSKYLSFYFSKKTFVGDAIVIFFKR